MGIPSSLGEVRAFLDTNGAGVTPWSVPGAPVDGLLALLHDRRDDDAFWDDLGALLGRVDSRRWRRGFELVDHQAIRALREELRGMPVPPRPKRIRSSTALAAAMMLGMAVA